MQNLNDTSSARLWYMDLFGSFRLEYGTQTVQFRNRIAGYILAYLLLHPRHEERRERIQTAFWPDDSQEDGANNLRVTLSRMRSAFQSVGAVPPVDITPSHIRIFPERFACDVLEFDRSMDRASDLERGPERTRHLRQAVRHYREPLLIETEFEWVREARYSREEKYLAALRELFLDARASDLQTDAIDYAIRLLREDPYQEDLQEWLDSRRERMKSDFRSATVVGSSTSAQATFPSGFETSNWRDDPRAVELRRWILGPEGPRVRVVVLPAGEFHAAYGIAVDCFVTAPAGRFDRSMHHVLDRAEVDRCLISESEPRLGSTKERLILIDATALPHEIEIPAETLDAKVLIIRSAPGSDDFLPSGFHSPFFYETCTINELYRLSLQQSQNYKILTESIAELLGAHSRKINTQLMPDPAKGQIGLLIRFCTKYVHGKALVSLGQISQDIIYDFTRGLSGPYIPRELKHHFAAIASVAEYRDRFAICANTTAGVHALTWSDQEFLKTFKTLIELASENIENLNEVFNFIAFLLRSRNEFALTKQELHVQFIYNSDKYLSL
ncbi:MAG: BTAD domain-containing putative transcriptional regulator, partial [Armatimonadota bacterium]